MGQQAHHDAAQQVRDDLQGGQQSRKKINLLPRRFLIVAATRAVTGRDTRRTKDGREQRMTVAGRGQRPAIFERSNTTHHNGVFDKEDNEVGRRVISSPNIFDREDDKSGDRTQRAAGGAEERVKDDSDRPGRRWRRRGWVRTRSDEGRAATRGVWHDV